MNREFFIVVCLTVAVNTGMGLIVPILPTFLQEYGFSTVGLSLPFLSLILGRMLSKSFAASIIRVLRNKRTLVMSFILYAAIFVAYPLFESATAFIALRFFEGVVEGISIVCLTDMAIVLSKKDRGRLMGIFGSSFGVGFILGPLIGGISYHFGGTDAIFYAGGVLGLIAAIASFTLPDNDNVSTKNANGWIRATIENAQFLPEYGPSIMRRAVFFSFMIVLPLYATQYLELDAVYVATFFTASAVISASLMPLTGRLADRIAPEKILRISLVMMALLIAGFGFTKNVYVFAAMFMLESLCFAFMLPAGMKVFADAVDNHPSRTVIISAYGGLTEAVTLVLAVLLPFVYSVSATASWFLIGAICAIVSIPFIFQKNKVVTGASVA